MKRLRIYLDTSVIGGCLDEGFAQESLALIDAARRGDIILVISDLLAVEVRRAPQRVQDVFDGLPFDYTELVGRSVESERLRDLYLRENVVGSRSLDDAHHVAIATVERVDMIVSWNFQHIVHFDKIRGFNAINLREGYSPIEIRSPKEVV